MADYLGILRVPDGDELYQSQKDPGRSSTSAHKPGSPRKSSQGTFERLTEEQLAVRLGVPQPETGAATSHPGLVQQFVEENRDELRALAQFLMTRGIEAVKPHAKRAFEEHAVPFANRSFSAGRSKLKQLRSARKARQMAAVPNAAAQPESHTELEPALADPHDGFALRTEMTADELRQCRAAAAELRAKAALIDRIADTAQVVPDRQTLELDGSAVTITERELPSTADLALDAPPSSSSDYLDQLRRPRMRGR